VLLFSDQNLLGFRAKPLKIPCLRCRMLDNVSNLRAKDLRQPLWRPECEVWVGIQKINRSLGGALFPELSSFFEWRPTHKYKG
jgi:hypothetical protein